MVRSRSEQLWNDIEGAGGIDAYIESQLRERGFLVERRDTEEMSRKELEVKGEGTPRVPRKLKYELRAAIHNASKGKGFKEGEHLRRLIGYAAFVFMVEPERDRKLFDALRELPAAE